MQAAFVADTNCGVLFELACSIAAAVFPRNSYHKQFEKCIYILDLTANGFYFIIYMK